MNTYENKSNTCEQNEFSISSKVLSKAGKTGWLMFYQQAGRASCINGYCSLSDHHSPRGRKRAAGQQSLLGEPVAPAQQLPSQHLESLFPRTWQNGWAAWQSKFLLLVKAKSGKNTKPATLGSHKTYSRLSAINDRVANASGALMHQTHAKILFESLQQTPQTILILRQRRRPSPGVCVRCQHPHPQSGLWSPQEVASTPPSHSHILQFHRLFITQPPDAAAEQVLPITSMSKIFKTSCTSGSRPRILKTKAHHYKQG